MQVVGEEYVWTCVPSIEIMNDNKVGLRGILPWKKFTLRTDLRGEKIKRKGIGRE